MKVCNLNNLLHKEIISSKTGEMYSKSAILTEQFDFKDIFIHHEILLPGRKTSAPHCHTSREEMVLVLNGSPTCYVGNKITTLKPGDFIGFKPSSAELHYVENLTDEVVQLLVMCSHPQDDQITY